MKNTVTVPKATFEEMPSPNQIVKIGARIRRGIVLSDLMNGSSARLQNVLSPSQRPTTRAIVVPVANARNVSSSVT
jgi:hypothetical protein